MNWLTFHISIKTNASGLDLSRQDYLPIHTTVHSNLFVSERERAAVVCCWVFRVFTMAQLYSVGIESYSPVRSTGVIMPWLN